MSHDKYKKWLLFGDELGESDKTELERHLENCAECRAERQKLKKLFSAFAAAKPAKVPEPLLLEARQELRVALRKERRRANWPARFALALRGWMPSYKIAFGGAALLFIGLAGGYALFSPRDDRLAPQFAQSAGSFQGGEPMIANVRFRDADARDGEVEFSFDAVTPVYVKGNVNDAEVQKVLSSALLYEQNPGVRLRAANAFRAYETLLPDPEVKSSLITALLSDENPAVRKEALSVLQKFPLDAEIKHSFLQVLSRDKNPGLRVAAIKSLEASRALDAETYDVLRDRLKQDDNDYIKERARFVLTAAKQL